MMAQNGIELRNQTQQINNNMQTFKEYIKEGREYIGVDFDATLSHYTGWKGPTHIGKPIPKMVNRIKKGLEQGKRFKIFTARANNPKAVKAIKGFLKNVGLPEFEVTNIKEPLMSEIWDDRARQVKPNTGEFVGSKEDVIEERFADWLTAGLVGASTLAGLPFDAQAAKHHTQPTKHTIIHQGKKMPEYNINIKSDLQTVKNLILKHEGIKYHVYKDTEGIPTIGIGMNLTNSDASNRLKQVGANYKKILNGQEDLNDQQIMTLFDQDVNTAIKTAKNFITNFDQLDETMQNVLIDMAFNLGPIKLAKFKDFKAALERKNYYQAASEMIDSYWYTQVGKRSKDLVNMVKTLV